MDSVATALLSIEPGKHLSCALCPYLTPSTLVERCWYVTCKLEKIGGKKRTIEQTAYVLMMFLT